MFILMSSFVLADISISEPSDIYNLGDMLFLKLDGLQGTSVGNLNINLACGNMTTNLIKIKARDFLPDEEQSYSTDIILNKADLEIENLNEVIGECQIISSLGFDIVSTKTFTISDNIIVTASLNKTSYDPGEAITVNIKANKANGDLLNGFTEGSNASDFSKAIENGFVSEIFFMSETIEAGVYYLNIYAYDEEIENKGSAIASFNINQVVSSLVMSLSDAEVVPGENFTVGVELFDQSGIKMEGAVSIKIISPENEKIESIVQADEFDTFDFALNSSIGTWKIVASFNDLIEEREFEMLGLQKVEFEIEDSVLSVTNIGNTLYNKTISVQIGNEVMNLELKINVGETRKFNLEAPIGEYEVLIDDGNNNPISRQVLLTGSVISVSDLKEVGIFKEYSIIWIFIIVVFGSVGAVLFVRYGKTRNIEGEGIIDKFIKKIRKITGKVENNIPSNVKSHMDSGLNFTNKSPKVQGLDAKNYSHEDKSMVDFTNKNAVGNAESSLVLKGEKYVSSVTALSIKNYGNLNEIAKESLHKIIKDAQKNKGVSDWRDDYVFIIFSPLVTKTYDNEILATRAGMEILNNLNAYNKKFESKIEFNIGIHSGELVTSRVNNKLKYTSMGNTISLAKKITDSDSGKLAVSESIRKKLIRDLQVGEKKEIGGNQVYEISEIRDKTANAAKLKDLLKRME